MSRIIYDMLTQDLYEAHEAPEVAAPLARGLLFLFVN